jgi:hypothetical protein
VLLQDVEHRRIAVGDAVDSLGQWMRPEPIADGLAHEPQRILQALEPNPSDGRRLG